MVRRLVGRVRGHRRGDRGLVSWFPERLTLPPGITTIDALLESGDGNVYLFAGASHWVYVGTAGMPREAAGQPLTALSRSPIIF